MTVGRSEFQAGHALTSCLDQSMGVDHGHDLHELDAFHERTASIGVTVPSVLEDLRIGEVAFESTGCWVNVNAPNAAHGVHSHSNNFFGGVFYVRRPRGGNATKFCSPRSQAGILRPPAAESTTDNTDQVAVEVGEGARLRFPAWLPHSVDADRGDKKRIGVSCNVVLCCYSAELSKPLR